jgi:hypothetical protein
LAKIHRAVLEALERKELPEEKLRKAAERIILQKLRYGLKKLTGFMAIEYYC